MHGNRQIHSDRKKEYCQEQFDFSDAKKKLEDEIKALDKEVAEATKNLYTKFGTGLLLFLAQGYFFILPQNYSAGCSKKPAQNDTRIWSDSER